MSFMLQHDTDVEAPSLSRRGNDLIRTPVARFRGVFEKSHDDTFDAKTNPNGFINLGIADNTAMIPDVVKRVNELNINYTDVSFSYGEGYWGSERLRTAMARFFDRSFHAYEKINPEDLIFASGISSLSEMLAFLLCDPGDSVLLPTPIYQSFIWQFASRAQGKPAFVHFEGVDQFTPACVEKFEKKLAETTASGSKCKALVLINPHNPLGQCYSKETLIAVMQFCNKHKIHLLCDEIYGTTVYDVDDPQALPFTSALSFDTKPYIDQDYLHVLYGLSKDLAAAGVRLGCIHLKNQHLKTALQTVGMFGWPSGPSQAIAATLLEDEKWCDQFFKKARSELSDRNRMVRKMLDEHGVKYHGGANAGFFIWVDLRPWLPKDPKYKDDWEREAALGRALLGKKMFMTFGNTLAAETPGFSRIIFSLDEDSVREGLRRIFEVLDAFAKENAALTNGVNGVNGH